MDNKFLGKSYKDLTIIGAIVVTIITFAPTAYNGFATVFGWGVQFNEANGLLAAQVKKNIEQDNEIDTVKKSVNSWRAVWCISELSKKQKPPQAVNNACQEWIRNP